jgi:hypothetical protein
MPIHFSCSCGQELSAAEEHAGRTTRCPGCGAELKIPRSSTAIQDEPRDLPERPRRRPREEDDRDDRPSPAVQDATSGKAILGFAHSFVLMCLPVIGGIISGIISIMALSDTAPGKLKGRGFAIAGIIVSVLSVILWLAATPFALIIPAVQRVREAAARAQSANNLKQIGLAFHNHNDVYGCIPPANFSQKPGAAPFAPNYGKPGLSWRVALLPFLQEDNLYRQFHLDEPWDSPNNRALLTRMPKVYAHSNADPAKTAAGLTHYRVFVGPGSAFDPTVGRTLGFPADFPDGTPNTILVVEAADPVEWTKPDDLDFGPGIPLPKLGVTPKTNFNVLTADAFVRPLSPNVSEITLRAAITRNGGEILGPDW